MIHLIYGADSYSSQEKLQSIISQYLSSSLGNTNIATLDFEDKKIIWEDVARQILSLPFLAPKRLVVLKSFIASASKSLQEKMEKFLEKIPESSEMVFYERKNLDNRLTFTKKIKSLANVEEYKPLECYELSRWVKNQLDSAKVAIMPAALSKVIGFTGQDLWRLKGELEKLIAYVYSSDEKKRIITTEDVELLVRPVVESNIFKFIDALGQKNNNQAWRELRKLLAKGENELYILSMIVYQFRNLLVVKDLSEREGISAILAKKSGLHPFVWRKTLSQTSNFSLAELKKIYKQLLKMEFQIKTGQVEPKLALDLLVAKI